MKKTTITISEKTWERLRELQRLGETFDSLLVRILNSLEDVKEWN